MDAVARRRTPRMRVRVGVWTRKDIERTDRLAEFIGLADEVWTTSGRSAKTQIQMDFEKGAVVASRPD
jgi:hypothetical protein